MMYDPLALDRQRQDQAELRRRVARAPEPTTGRKAEREPHGRHHGLRRMATATSSS